MAKSEQFDKTKIHPLQRAWAAGVIDGKATFPRSGYQLTLDSTDEALVKRLYETLGIGKAWKREHKRSPVPVWRYETNSMDTTRDLLLTVAPFLSARKTAQAAELVAKIERNPNWIKQQKKASSQENT